LTGDWNSTDPPTALRTAVDRTPVFGILLRSYTFPGVTDVNLLDHIVKMAEAAEATGFHSMWATDHFYQVPLFGRPDEPMLEAYTLLSAIGARTSRIKLGPLVTGVTYRNPALVAKLATALDVITRGRAILGIGAAWEPNEHAGYGLPVPGYRRETGDAGGGGSGLSGALPARTGHIPRQVLPPP
jgi:alkanesulfonate monooxygenase SsuD/methylene tetrahydromethanopterin reductase-like flavin-dependent oxidoreductase (luciferase family)